MGFNKRYLNKEKVMDTKESDLPRLFNVDALIMDIWSRKFLELYNEGHSKNQIIQLIKDEATRI
tara:strand:- start:701 stop:892 length:192 start_codon:yes stop_codon:yes gene_type:complete